MIDEKLVDEIYAVLVERFGVGEVCVKKYQKRAETTWKDFITMVLDGVADDELAEFCGFSEKSPLSKYLKREFPEICKDRGTNRYWFHYFNSLVELKKCSQCLETKSTSCFTKNNQNKVSGLKSICSDCSKIIAKEFYTEHKEEKAAYKIRHRAENLWMYAATEAKRRATKLKATPKWADLERIKEVYRTCPEGYHVDHIVPLQGKLVCGLHCEFNLQHLPATENMIKSNKFIPC